MMNAVSISRLFLLLVSAVQVEAFVSSPSAPAFVGSSSNARLTRLFAADEKAAPMVTGEELEIMLTEWEEPLVIDAYATWCGPCLLMAPEFEAAAQEYKGKVRFVKLDTDKNENMAARLNIMGLPTLLFLDKYEATGDEEDVGARALLKGRIEGALRKQNIKDLCEFHFFGGEQPKM